MDGAENGLFDHVSAVHGNERCNQPDRFYDPETIPIGVQDAS